MHLKRVILLIVMVLTVVTLSAQNTAKSSLPGDPGRWEMVWNDEFDYQDSCLVQKWESQNGPSGHILCSRWRENAVVSNGTLKLVKSGHYSLGRKYYRCHRRNTDGSGLCENLPIQTVKEKL